MGNSGEHCERSRFTKQKSEMQYMTYESLSIEDTAKIGEELAKNTKRGDIFCLAGNLGAGKTVFAGGFAKGLGINCYITSPTFTILNEYHEGRLCLYHFDLYRLKDPNELFGIGYEEYFFGDGVTLVEWPERAESLIPQNAVFITIETDFSICPNFRRITIN